MYFYSSQSARVDLKPKNMLFDSLLLLGEFGFLITCLQIPSYSNMMGQNKYERKWTAPFTKIWGSLQSDLRY